MNNGLPEQLPLAITLTDRAELSNFVAGPNAEIVRRLEVAVNGKSSDGSVFIWGRAGSGKSHLLQAACSLAARRETKSVYLPLRDHAAMVPSLLEGLENMHVVAIDDVQSISGQAEWESALFHLYNRAFETGAQLVFAGDAAIASLGIQLADLRSRLAWGFVFHLAELSEAEKALALQQRAHARGFALPENVANYLLRHYQRDMRSLFELLDKLDFATLAQQRRLTVPFVRGLLKPKSSN